MQRHEIIEKVKAVNEQVIELAQVSRPHWENMLLWANRDLEGETKKLREAERKTREVVYLKQEAELACQVLRNRIQELLKQGGDNSGPHELIALEIELEQQVATLKEVTEEWNRIYTRSIFLPLLFYLI